MAKIPKELPVAGAARPERADAARNRRRVLAAARRLFDERGIDAVTMSDVAREAGVAKGTIFHRFGDRAGLAQALVDDAERELQDRILRGPPPLGPGAPPRERLLAFLDALLTLTAEHRGLLLAVDSAGPSARHRSGAYRGWLQHTALLLDQIGATQDAAVLAHALLALVSPELIWHLQEDEQRSPSELRAVVLELARRVTARSIPAHTATPKTGQPKC